MPDKDEDARVLNLLREAAVARQRVARAMLDAYAANALPQPATKEDLQHWQAELKDAENEIARLSH